MAPWGPSFSQLADETLGPNWRNRLLTEFSINPRSVQRWAAGQDEPPQAILDMLTEIRQVIERYRRKP